MITSPSVLVGEASLPLPLPQFSGAGAAQLRVSVDGQTFYMPCSSLYTLNPDVLPRTPHRDPPLSWWTYASPVAFFNALQVNPLCLFYSSAPLWVPD